MNSVSSAFRVFAALSCAAWAAVSCATSFAADSNSSSPALRSRSLAQMYPNGLRARDVMRMNVRTSAGKDLGKVSDLVVDARSGQIVYAIVSTGGVLGVGDRLRAVPVAALHFANDRREGFAIDLPASEFERAPAFTKDQLAALSDETRADYIFRAYHQEWQPLSAPTESDASTSGYPLRLASSLIDRDVRSGEQVVGKTEDLVVNLDSRKAAFLVAPDERYAGTADRFVVPFGTVAAGSPESDTLAARVNQDNFKSAQPFDQSAWDSNSGVYRWKIAGP